MSEWIFCKERMPESDDECLVATVFDDIRMCSYYPPGELWNEAFWEWDGGGTFDCDDVIAWMPLPPLPLLPEADND